MIAHICDYDRYAAMILSRDTRQRRQFVNDVKTFLEQKYAQAYNNPADDEFRTRMTRLFELANDTSRIANVMQMFIIHCAVMLEPEIARALCPPEPPQDDRDAVDHAHVDRIAFCYFEQQYLLPLFGDMLNGRNMDVFKFVDDLGAAYTSLLPPNPVEAAEAPINRRRRIVFRDRTTTFMPS